MPEEYEHLEITWRGEAPRTGITISVVVDVLEVTIVSAATPLQRARATTPKATQVALRRRMLRLEVDMVVYYLLYASRATKMAISKAGQVQVRLDH